MSVWKWIAERMRGGTPGEAERRPLPEEDVGMTYADLERDKARKEDPLSGAGFTASAEGDASTPEDPSSNR